jgi:GT2 family glycosyltransferase
VIHPTIDVIVPTYRPGAWLSVCLGSVVGSHGVEVQLVVIDDLPRDAEVRRQVREFPGARVMTPESNLGFAAAINLGLASGHSPYVLLLNQDARLEPDALARLHRRLEDDPTLASVGAKVLHQAAPDIRPDGTIDTVGIEFRRGRRPIDIGQGAVDEGQFDGLREVFGVCAAVALYRRSALEQVAVDGQVLDESFFMHKEDVDLAWRLRHAGYRAAVDGAAVAYHARGTARAPESRGHRGPLSTARDLFAAERRKEPEIRRLAWRNQMRLLIKNETAAGLRRSMPSLLAQQLAYATVGLALDPIGTLLERGSFVLWAPAFIARRNKGARHRHRADMPAWLP